MFHALFSTERSRILPRSIVFDLDDTLYLERDYVRSGFQAVGAWAKTALGVPDFAERAWLQFENGVRGSTFQNILAECGAPPDSDLIAQMVSIYREHIPRIKLLPDAVHCLSALKGKAQLAIITDGPATCQQAKCAGLGVRDFVDVVVCTGEWGPEYSKPHPRAFEFIMQRFQNGNGAFVYVADNPLKDFHAPTALGWDTVRIRRPGGLHFAKEGPAEFAPQCDIADLWHFPELVAAAHLR